MGNQKNLKLKQTSNSFDYKEATITTSCNSEINYEGKTIKILMINVSSKKATFQVLEQRDNINLKVNSEHNFTVQTPYGTSFCRAQIRWNKKISQYVTFGVEFSELPKEANDPLLTYIDSPF